MTERHRLQCHSPQGHALRQRQLARALPYACLVRKHPHIAVGGHTMAGERSGEHRLGHGWRSRLRHGSGGGWTGRPGLGHGFGQRLSWDMGSGSGCGSDMGSDMRYWPGLGHRQRSTTGGQGSDMGSGERLEPDIG